MKRRRENETMVSCDYRLLTGTNDVDCRLPKEERDMMWKCYYCGRRITNDEAGIVRGLKIVCSKCASKATTRKKKEV